MSDLFPVLFVLGSYLLGAVPFGLLIGLARGVDIRQHGSRNIGATNTGRVLGKPWGYVALILDVLKGLIPTILARQWIIHEPLNQNSLLLWLLVGLAAILGHVFPVYLGFRGGKGVATSIGVGLGIYPFYSVGILFALAVYAVARFGTGFVSVGSIALAAAFPAGVYGYLVYSGGPPLREAWPLIAGAVVIGGLILVRHAGNIRRLRAGQEHRA
jgi:glycerol-3-phosphate acyltransferase PlsY